jgi:molybdopterin converting factor small subunit
MAVLLLFGPARTAAGTARVAIDAPTVSSLCDAARDQFGAGFAQVLDNAAVWVNGEPLCGDPPIGATDEVAVLPPVSGGA